MFTLEYAKDPFWNNPNGNCIQMTVKWVEFNEEMPFSATSFDPEPHGIDLFNRAKAGEFGEIKPFVEFVPPIIDFEPTPSGQ